MRASWKTRFTWALLSLGVVFGLTACQPTQEMVELSDTRPGATNVIYDFSAVRQNGDINPVRCSTFKFSLNADGTGGPPPGMDLSLAARVFSPALPSDDIDVPHISSTYEFDNSAGTLKINSNVSNAATAGPQNRVHYRVGGITNGSVKNQTYYVTGNFYNSASCTGSSSQDKNDTPYVLPFQFTDTPVKVKPAFTAQVLPAISMTVGARSMDCSFATANVVPSTATLIDYGRMVPGVPKSSSHYISFDSNGKGGADVTLRAQPLAGSRNIAMVTGTTSTPADFGTTEGYGFRTSSFGSNKWAALPVSTPFTIASENAPRTGNRCVDYRLMIDGATPFETFTGSLTYTLIPRF